MRHVSQASSIRPLHSLLLLQLPLWLIASPVAAQVTTVADGERIEDPVDLRDDDQLVVEEGGVISVEDDDAIKLRSPASDVVITNGGLIEAVGDGERAIDDAGDSDGTRNYTLVNLASGTIRSDGDAFRISDDVTNGSVVVTNSGLIESMNGQAIDFNDLESTGTDTASVLITNLSGGTIRSMGADAIRPGQGSTVDNAGLIFSDGVIGDRHDAIDLQQFSGNIINRTGGVISGQRHGIASDINIDLVNEEGGLVVGRNGAGVNSDGEGRVINFGTIRGEYVGEGIGDGDGVDIDGFGIVENYGLIEATGGSALDRNGERNFVEGIALTGGGSILNADTGVIRSVGVGVTAVTPSQTAITVENNGRISGVLGVLTSGGGSATVINAGHIQGDVFAIRMVGSQSTLVIREGSIIDGTVQATAGQRNTLVLEDGAVFDTATNFGTLNVTGNAALIGENVFDIVNIDEDVTLSVGNGGTTGGFSGDVNNSGGLLFDRSDDLTIGNRLSGTGNVIKVGANRLTLTGFSDYSGQTQLRDGTLVVDGSIANSTVVLDDVTRLSGTGTIGGLSIEGGTVDLNSYTQSYANAGNIDIDSDSTVLFDATAEGGTGSSLTASGDLNIAEGATLRVTADRTFNLDQSVTVASVGGAVNGAFAASSNFAFLRPDLDFVDGDLMLSLSFDEQNLVNLAQTTNQASVASAIAGIGDRDVALFDDLLFLSTDGAANALQTLTGDLYGGIEAGLIDESNTLRRTLMPAGQHADRPDGFFVEADAFTASYDQDGTADSVGVDGDADYLIGRVGYTAGGLSGRVGVGVGSSDYEAAGSADISTTTLSADVHYAMTDALHVQIGGIYSSHDADTVRTVVIDDDTTVNSGELDASSRNLFAHVGYDADLGAIALRPFADISNIKVSTDAFVETGGSAVLGSDDSSHSATYGRVGLALSTDVFASGGSVSVTPFGSAAYRARLGDDDEARRFELADAGTSFSSLRNALADDALEAEAGLRISGARWALQGSYGLAASSSEDNQYFRLNASTRF